MKITFVQILPNYKSFNLASLVPIAASRYDRDCWHLVSQAYITVIELLFLIWFNASCWVVIHLNYHAKFSFDYSAIMTKFKQRKFHFWVMSPTALLAYLFKIQFNPGPPRFTRETSPAVG